MRKKYRMTKEQLDKIMGITKADEFRSQMDADIFWEALGKELGFDHRTVKRAHREHHSFFTAVPIGKA